MEILLLNNKIFRQNIHSVTYLNKYEIPTPPKIFVTICHKKDQYPPPPNPLVVTYFLNDPLCTFNVRPVSTGSMVDWRKNATSKS